MVQDFEAAVCHDSSFVVLNCRNTVPVACLYCDVKTKLLCCFMVTKICNRPLPPKNIVRTKFI